MFKGNDFIIIEENLKKKKRIAFFYDGKIYIIKRYFKFYRQLLIDNWKIDPPFFRIVDNYKELNKIERKVKK